MSTKESQIKVYGWYSDNEEWIPIQVTSDGSLVVTS